MLKETGQDRVRELLTRLTGYIPNEGLAGAIFAATLILTDHLYNLKGNANG